MLTWAEIDLEAIFHNLRQIKNRADSRGVKVLVVVKDNAYGHGTVEVARTAASMPAYMLGVAAMEEAIEIRNAGIKLPILRLTCILPEQAAEVIQYDITQTVGDVDVCKALSERALRSGKQAKIHVKIDTGMGRIGIQYDKAADFLKEIKQIPGLDIEGIFTHFASAEEDMAFTNVQLERFGSTISSLGKMGIRIPLIHAANSTAFLDFPDSYFDMVRVGLITYGLYFPGPKRVIDLKPALSLKTRVVHLKEIPAGWGVSYGRTYTTKKTALVATLPIGYGHGYSRRLSNKGEALIRGMRASIIGTVCMDQCLCDVTHIPGVSIGDEAVLIGKQGDESITTDEMAQKLGTIPEVIFCAINPSMPRIFHSANRTTSSIIAPAKG